jgi:hypothetical protein
MASSAAAISSALIRRGGQQMLNQTTLLADELGKQLSRTFLRSFGRGDQRIAALLDEAPRLVIERRKLSLRHIETYGNLHGSVRQLKCTPSGGAMHSGPQGTVGGGNHG